MERSAEPPSADTRTLAGLCAGQQEPRQTSPEPRKKRVGQLQLSHAHSPPTTDVPVQARLWLQGRVTMDSITAGAAASSRKPGLLINRDYAFLWLGQSVSIIGDLMFTTTLVIWIGLGLGAHQTWAPVAVSAVLMAAAAPTLVVGVFAGVFVDRVRKRPMMLWMDGLRALIVAALVVAGE